MVGKLLSVVALCSVIFAAAAAAAPDLPSFVIEGRVLQIGMHASVIRRGRPHGGGDDGRHRHVPPDRRRRPRGRGREVVLVESPRADCSVIKPGRDRARVLLTHNSGLATNEEPLPSSGALLAQNQLGDDE
ncbi:unnamed protein product [Spirodela intermedia]|uniref:Uncharacterized protein n=2 Tax=Spirodela intermedia TaxID=51605 RepID=A0A7I8I8B3_SPIIN|nr:unnamed protein product [Spirodela intermedia]CAA6653820.1 unnamed protein product [Spirodela intermedia]CAA7388220.1 unnamed protein product [Spirodela intermedia]